MRRRRLGVAEKGAQHIVKTASRPKTYTPARPLKTRRQLGIAVTRKSRRKPLESLEMDSEMAARAYRFRRGRLAFIRKRPFDLLAGGKPGQGVEAAVLGDVFGHAHESGPGDGGERAAGRDALDAEIPSNVKPKRSAARRVGASPGWHSGPPQPPEKELGHPFVAERIVGE